MKERSELYAEFCVTVKRPESIQVVYIRPTTSERNVSKRTFQPVSLLACAPEVGSEIIRLVIQSNATENVYL